MTAVGGVLWLGTLLVGPRGQAGFTAASAVAFLGFAITLLARDVLPRLG